MVVKNLAVKNAQPANRQTSTKIPILGPTSSKIENPESLFKEDGIVYKTSILEDQSLRSVIFCNGTKPLGWFQ